MPTEAQGGLSLYFNFASLNGNYERSIMYTEFYRENAVLT